MNNLITFKIEYQCDSNLLLDVVKQYNSVLRFTYNRLIENPKLKTPAITSLQKQLNNVDLIGSHLKNSAIYDAKSIVERGDTKVIFGGKSLFLDRCSQKITHDEFVLKRLRPLNSVGEANKHGNRLFQMIDTHTIIFKLNRNNHFTLNLKNIGKKRIKELEKIIQLQNACILPITYKLDLNYVYITFDYSFIKYYKYTVKENRVFAIDMNPNSIGWTVVDWYSDNKYHVVQSGTFSLKPLNDYEKTKHVSSDDKFHKYITNKRKHEVIEIAKQLFKLCKYYHCEIFSIEELVMEHKDNKRGNGYNRLVNNNWNRSLLVNQIRKHINSSSTTLVEIQPQYNSYIGNLIFRHEKLPDECLASIEIGRRGYEFATQYIFHRRLQQKTVIFPKLESVKNQLALSLEELGIDVPDFNAWDDILSEVKKSKVKYRFSFSEARHCHSETLFSKFYKQKYLEVYTYL